MSPPSPTFSERSSKTEQPPPAVMVRSGDVLFVGREATAFREGAQSLLLQRLFTTVLSILDTGVSALSLDIALTNIGN